MADSGNENSGALQALGAVACLFAAAYLCFIEGRGVDELPFSLPVALALMIAGLLAGGWLLGIRAVDGVGAPALLAPSLASALLWAGAGWLGLEQLVYGACFAGTIALPPAMGLLYRHSRAAGLHFGMAVAMASFFWLFLYFLPQSPSGDVVMYALAGLEASGGLFAVWALTGRRPPEEDGAEPAHAVRQRMESLRYLTAVAAVYFLLSAFIDIAFYRIHTAAFPVPAHVHLYTWAAYPLAGLFIDRCGCDVRLLLFGIAVVFLAPFLVVFSDDSVFFWALYTLNIVCRGIVLLYLLLVFGRVGRRFDRLGLAMAVPLAVAFAAWLGMLLLIERVPGVMAVMLICLVLSASFSYVSAKVQYALTLSGIGAEGAEPEPAEGGGAGGPEHRDMKEENGTASKALALFSSKYGLSAREQAVLLLLTEGADTASVCERLYISENTLKTHVRQILRKTEARNRVSLVALYFSDLRKLYEQGGAGRS
ncbi:MAG: helix-turn-helix transcriptional regulator [Desulfovibrio sp.]|nr:helix-turn-helix transcriptional regulator [Desulfovibrio sp.]